MLGFGLGLVLSLFTYLIYIGFITFGVATSEQNYVCRHLLVCPEKQKVPHAHVLVMGWGQGNLDKLIAESLRLFLQTHINNNSDM